MNVSGPVQRVASGNAYRQHCIGGVECQNRTEALEDAQTVSPSSSGLFRKHRIAVALSALLLLFGSSWSPATSDTRSLTAILLVARNGLPDPDFADSVVLVMNNLGPAPVGVIVNRPTKIAVAELFPQLKQLTRLHDKVYFGGPVEYGSVWFLFRASSAPEHAIRAIDGLYLSADEPLLMRLLNRDKPMDGLRIFIGHSGWAPGQLESEIANGDWALQHANPEAIFNGKSEHAWPAPQGQEPST
jgi:putative transcriptional regulator